MGVDDPAPLLVAKDVLAFLGEDAVVGKRRRDRFANGLVGPGVGPGDEAAVRLARRGNGSEFAEKPLAHALGRGFTECEDIGPE